MDISCINRFTSIQGLLAPEPLGVFQVLAFICLTKGLYDDG